MIIVMLNVCSSIYLITFGYYSAYKTRSQNGEAAKEKSNIFEGVLAVKREEKKR